MQRFKPRLLQHYEMFGMLVRGFEIGDEKNKKRERVETPSNTANHQRLAEMFVHLTPIGARIPYR
ncbi:unnamed protein product [Onchocerca flexuosa]|uniref:Transposase n=1 Tax=Onchocerca flexuosa TaxID=387005 RepID=A0A183H0U8_9BILA|nr:unnamed protein product [Onchocerca flexuosa]